MTHWLRWELHFIHHILYMAPQYSIKRLNKPFRKSLEYSSKYNAINSNTNPFPNNKGIKKNLSEENMVRKLIRITHLFG